MARFRYKAVAPTGSIVEGELEAQARPAAIERLREMKHLPVRVEEVAPEEPKSSARRAEQAGRIEPRLEPRREPPPAPPAEEPLLLSPDWIAEPPPAAEPAQESEPEPESEPPPVAEEPRIEPLIERLSLDAADVAGTMEPVLGGSFAPVEDPTGRIEPSVEPEPEPVASPQPPAEESPSSYVAEAVPDPESIRPLRWDVGEDVEATATAPAPDPVPSRWEEWRDAEESPPPEPPPARWLTAEPVEDARAPEERRDDGFAADPPGDVAPTDRPVESVDWGASAYDAAPRDQLAAYAPPAPIDDAGEPLPGSRAEAPPKEKKKKRGKNALPAHLLPVFTRELQVLLAAGLPMDRALRIVVEATADDRVAAAADALLARVRSGSLLSEAMEAMPERFDEFLRTAVRAGEAGGALPEVLDQVATYQERSQRLARSVRTALIYPSILAFAAAMSVILLLTVVVPQFEMLFRQSGQTPPFATQMVIRASTFLRDYGWIVPAAIAFFWIVLRWRYADARRGQFLHRRALRLPLVGKVIAGVSVERFARALGTLLGNGVALPDALGLVGNTVPNRAIGAVVAASVDRVKQGERLGDTLEEGGAMPLLAVQLVRVGEESGRLVEMLSRLADIYAQEVDTAVRRLTSMIEPVLILVIGIVVGGIVLSLLSAIAGLNALAL